ncbi:xanthine dehydrogenase family protein molybdopterin-binding subunit [Tindallia californiensis]|uniref:CO or xanthine dehydrogenase, Mo-binding subunit n=1 Tax=Tindallia californiensis TaxID=159292 RepID=A0A1H3PTA6_9FIRM|nr:xanthine dehydrogenase family protein molybdopterin-binding subunit [Tindallia californiensis]SDZ04276.1 CO or xanthine dehydrogenase, Mo-binding subunit [Tindallia californiensis]
MKYVGQNQLRVDGIKKVTGDLKFVDDLKMQKMLYASVKRSPHAHAKIIDIDTSLAENYPGVRAVVTGKDFPKRAGLYLADKTFFAVDKVRFTGEAVAAVAADTEEIAKKAAALIEVKYELLPAVHDAKEAMKSDAPILHPELGDYKVVPIFKTVPGTNISEHFKLRKGNVEEAFEKADMVFEKEYYVPHIQHAPIENHVAISQFDREGNLTVWASCQSPYAVRAALSDAFDIPLHKLRVISPAVGGGFGAKAGTTLEGIIIPLSMKVGNRPVKLTYNREEEFISSYVRQALHSKFKTAVNKDGKILAVKNEFIWDGGAYTEYGVNIAKSAGFAAVGPYDVENIHCDSYAVYTNNPVGGPYRGFGMAEIHFGIEQNMDYIARQLEMDPITIRKINAQKPGGTTATGAKVDAACGLTETLDTVIKEIDYYTPSVQPKDPDKVRAKGIACGMKAPSMPNNAGSAAIVRINEDGSVMLSVSAQDLGQGSDTALVQIAAEALQIPPEKISIKTGDTDHTPYEWQTVASRITYSAGNAIIKACEDATQQLTQLASQKMDVPQEELFLEDEHLIWKKDPDKKVAVKALALGLQFEDGSAIHGPIIGRGSFVPEGVVNFDPETGLSEKPVVFWTYGAYGVEIEVDKKTGNIQVLKATTCFDVGKAINPELVKAQCEGAVVQGLGSAIFEEIIMKDGKFKNPSFADYKIPTADDMPEMTIHIAENPQYDGPYGARGMAEPAMIPAAPSIVSAFYNATGVVVEELPLSAERVAKALKE